MLGSREHIDGFGAEGGVGVVGEELEVAGEGGGVAGNVDDAAGGHLGDGVDDLRGEAAAGRVDDDDVGADALGGELGGDLGGVAAEEVGVGDMVAQGVLSGVLNGLGNDLRANDALCVPGQAQRDGADAAVEVQDRLRPGEAGHV